jgi:hypothetical protein
MSATGRSLNKRRPNDHYATPQFCLHRLLDEVALPEGPWLEPSAGLGALIQAVNSHNSVTPVWDANELSFWAYQKLRPLCQNLFIGDFLKTDFEVGKYKVIITNPPYSLAMDFIEKALSLKPEKLVLLLRVNFLGSEKRCSFFRNNSPDVYLLPNRPSFAFGGTDACEYGFFVWGKEPQEFGKLRVLQTTPGSKRK